LVVSTRRVRVLLVGIAVVGMALGVMGVLGAVGSASPNNDDHGDDKGRSTLTVVGKNPENKVLDLGAQGPSQGDIRVLNAPLYDESGKERIGRFDLFCAITDPADESSEKAHIAQCTKTFTLPGGEISVQGVEAYPNLSGLSPGVNAISGGTGKYAGVSGEQRFELRGKKVIDTFHFID
jgi:Allene oxide cyclase barrel like domain